MKKPDAPSKSDNRYTQ